MMEGMESLRGQLLIAGAGLIDPNFRRTIVLIGEHNEEGALGVALNRPSPLTVGDAIPSLGRLAPPDDPVFIGGPVQPESVVVLAEFGEPKDAGLLVLGSIGFLVGEVEAGAVDAVRRARIFAGHAGWGPGQLERELEEEAWIQEPALPEDVFTDTPDELWTMVLRRKGRDFAILALMPLDPSMN